MICAFVFDLDGTLDETEEFKALSYARAAAELRPDLNEKENHGALHAYRPDPGRTSLNAGLRGVPTDRRFVSGPPGVPGLRSHDHDFADTGCHGRDSDRGRRRRLLSGWAVVAVRRSRSLPVSCPAFPQPVLLCHPMVLWRLSPPAKPSAEEDW